MQRRPFFSRFAAAFLLGFVGCASPTIPLPPPGAPEGLFFDATTSEWTISGSCNAGALVTVFNEATGLGSVVEDRDQDGLYEVTIVATECDVAWVAQQVVQDISATNAFVIQAKVNGLPVDPAACK